MGIDAEILVKHKGQKLTEAEVRRLAYRLASTIGPDHFMIDFGKHGWHALNIIQPLEADDGYPELLGKVAYCQDGPPVLAEPGEQFLRCYLSTRYYGQVYERGDWQTIRSVIEWLWMNIEGCEVWYGGDSSGVLVELVTQDWLKAMNEHWLRQGRGPYLNGFGSFREQNDPRPVCPCCDEPLRSNGGGGGQTFWFCSGCAQVAVTPGPHFGSRREDVFALAKRMREEAKS